MENILNNFFSESDIQAESDYSPVKYDEKMREQLIKNLNTSIIEGDNEGYRKAVLLLVIDQCKKLEYNSYQYDEAVKKLNTHLNTDNNQELTGNLKVIDEIYDLNVTLIRLSHMQRKIESLLIEHHNAKTIAEELEILSKIAEILV